MKTRKKINVEAEKEYFEKLVWKVPPASQVKEAAGARTNLLFTLERL
jgi:hypothetical protein